MQNRLIHNDATVAVLLSHYDGYLYLREQVDSIRKQTGVNTHLVIRDDGSTCAKSRLLLNELALEYPGFIRVVYGANIGVCSSFFELVKAVSGYSFYAFADQDDYWDNDKLCVAVNALKDNAGTATLYCSNLRVVDSDLEFIAFKHSNCYPSFYTSIFRNICTGCTAVFNDELRSVFMSVKNPVNPAMHDWWFYMLAASIGRVIYDKNSKISYRQHGNNVIGSELKWTHMVKRRCSSFLNYGPSDFSRHSQAVDLLDVCGHMLSSEKREFLSIIAHSKSSIRQRLKLTFHERLELPSRIDLVVLRLLLLSGRF